MVKNDPRFYGILSDGGPGRGFAINNMRQCESKMRHGISENRHHESQRGSMCDILADRPGVREQRFVGAQAGVLMGGCAANYV